MTALFAPGDIVFARGREWVTLPSPDEESLCLRPLSGTEADVQVICPALEREPVRPARFSPPTADQIATQDAARLLSDALRLSLRRGAGPFRCAARLGFEPRAYQLVPLLMALRLPVVRLLIADDVGIGKTIEGGLILRELIDRGEADRLAVLCPPHLVEQWTGELKNKFDLDAVAVTASSASRLERDLPPSQTLFDAYPFTVVSLDYIKADRRRESFARACPALVIVDEAHACVGTHQSRQQRFALLKRLSEDRERHLILLTATPHSGDEAAFDRLLGLLDEGFSTAAVDSDAARVRLARHFVQRRRIDIMARDWGEDRIFPRHESAERHYNLGAEHRAFHDAVLDYCLGVVEGAGPDTRRRRLAFWGTLALMRCVGSSPAAAASALRNRLAADPDRLEEQIFDDDADEADAVDVEPAPGLEVSVAVGARHASPLQGEKDEGLLSGLVREAERLAAALDPKLAAAVAVLKPLVAEGANPVVFCRFIATSDHVASGLRKAFPKLRVEVVTGDLPSEERRAKVESMLDAGQRLLVATDCLSEGINLQNLFDTVIHYDLSWNPTRHQQREGRVDRFGQPRPLVRSVLLYSPDSAIDGAVLDVILRKAEAIRKATGVTVPLPDERGAVTGALMNAVLLRKGRGQQLSLDFGLDADVAAMETRWRNAEEGERRSRARFAQNAMKPEEVIPQWQRWRDLLGTPDQVRRFVERAMSRLDAPLEQNKGDTVRAHLAALPVAVAERLAARGLEGDVRLAFEEPAPSGAEMVTRSHPLPATLAETLLEGALDPGHPARSEARIAGLYSAVRDNVRLVVIDLDDRDDAQVIFETLNARGTPLLSADLVKNSLLNEVQSQNGNADSAYERYWRKFDTDAGFWREQVGRGHAQRARIETFLQHSLTLLTNNTVSSTHLYSAYRDFAVSPGAGTSIDRLEKFQRLGVIYKRLHGQHSNKRINTFFDRLRTLDVVTAWPFILALFERFEGQPEVVEPVLVDLESFLVRRMVCRLSTRAYGDVFANLTSDLHSAKENSPAAIRSALLAGTAEIDRWPYDDTFRTAWLGNPLYENLTRPRMRMLLEAMEAGLRNSFAETEVIPRGLTIEHVMPQGWRDHWPLTPGMTKATRDSRVQTIGNLTLLNNRLNPSQSNKPWVNEIDQQGGKRGALKAHSVLYLNKALCELDDWNDDCILARSADLFAIALKIWPRGGLWAG